MFPLLLDEGWVGFMLLLEIAYYSIQVVMQIIRSHGGRFHLLRFFSTISAQISVVNKGRGYSSFNA